MASFPTMGFMCRYLLLLFAAAFASEEIPQDNGVYVLSVDNFDKFIEQNPTTLVEFYAPWCGHCKKLGPEYEQAAKKLKSSSPSVPLAKVDVTKEELLGEKYGIKGFPTLKFWKSGEMTEYDGPRDADGIVDWVRQKADTNYKPPPEAVITLGKDNFTNIVYKEPLILVEFYAPWCGHCKNLAPEYEKAAKRLKQEKPPILLAKVDATVESDLAKEHQVTGYPTLKLFRNGRKSEYTGPREALGIIDYMLENIKPAAKEIKTVKEAKRFMSDDDVTILGFFDDTESNYFKNFKDAAEGTREDFKNVAYSFDKEVLAHFKAKPDQIRVYQPEKFWSKYEPKFKEFDNLDASREDLIKFFQDSAAPLVGHRTQENQGKRFAKRPLVVVYYNVDFSLAHREGTQYWRQKVLKIAKDNTMYHFAISDEEEFTKELEDVGLGDSGLEVNVVVFGKDGRRYPWRADDFDEFSEESFKEFMKKVNLMQVKPHVKSQAAPKDVGPVKSVVAKNFDKIVMDDTKDVLIEFYAPWCGHCKQLEPIYKQLAEKHKAESNLVIAKMDATANDVPETFKVEGFPTIYFAPAGKKDRPLKYEGARTVEAMENFLKTTAVLSFKKTEL